MHIIHRIAGLSAAMLFAAMPFAVSAQQEPATPAPARAGTLPSERGAPELIVAISVDQLGGDLFEDYRGRFTGGLARLQKGAVFPNGYQSHAATETCPGHSTILTGARPARTGIVANQWVDLGARRDDKLIYCVEDESIPGTTSRDYRVSLDHLLVPTLGDRMKARDPSARVISVAGKDRSAVLLGGKSADHVYWWQGGSFGSYPDTAKPEIVARANAAIAARIGEAQPPVPLSPFCRARAVPVTVGGRQMGAGAFGRDAGDAGGFRLGPEFDAATLALAAALTDQFELGRRGATDLLSIGLSGTDYVGHALGSGGSEMCVQLESLDASLGAFFVALDARGIDYLVVLTGDHGGLDIPERADVAGELPGERLAGFDLAGIARSVAGEIGGELGLGDDWIVAHGSEIYLAPTSSASRSRALAMLEETILAHPQVEDVLTRAEISAAPAPSGDPATWSLATRAQASYHPKRSGQLVVVLKQGVTPISEPGPGYVATHGSFWDYDRRVPILFYRPGIDGFESPAGIETVDIAPTLAGAIGLSITRAEIDGQCIDIDTGQSSTCD